MPEVRVATFNVENLFARPKALDTLDWKVGKPILAAYQKVNVIMGKAAYSDPDRVAMRDLLIKLDVYYRNEHGAIRRRETRDPLWAWLRKNRGIFDRQPVDPTRDVEIVAVGRDDWIGWVELATETVDELSTRMTGRVITDVEADILAVIEVEDRPTLSRFNDEMLNGTYEHVRLFEGNDTRGIDVGLMTKPGFEVESMQTHVDLEDNVGRIFSRDCAHYAVRTPSGPVLHVLVNHFKSQSGGGGTQRQRQAAAVRSIATELVDAGESVVVLGDLNEGPETAGEPPTNLATLFDPAGPLRSCYDLPGFDLGPRLGTFDSCGLSNRLDYIFISADLPPRFRGGSVLRSGLWGSRKTRPTAWDVYPDITTGTQQASDHSALSVRLNL